MNPSAARWVLHVDMDAFYASVESREDPSLKGRPVLVGGTGGRGVVCSASYEARRFGVRSATPMAQARRLCPQAVVLAPRFELYQRYSRVLHLVFNEITPLVEGIGLDEAFLDVTGATTLLGPPQVIAARARQEVQRQLGLSCSVGAGPNKLVAKLASKEAKPRVGPEGVSPGRGTVIVPEAEVLGFLWPMPVEALWGVGRATAQRLHKLGVTTVGSLAALPAAAAVSALGKGAGELVYQLAWGRDERAVVPDRAPKSIGHEETYPEDVTDRDELLRRLVMMADSVASRLREHDFVARTVTLKLRYGDFATVTRSHTFSTPEATGPALWTAAAALLGELDLRQGARLLGVTASGLLPSGTSPGQQLQLDLASGAALVPGLAASGAGHHAGAREEAPSRSGASMGDAGTSPAWDRASRAVDAVRARFGDTAVGPAVGLGGRRRPRWPSGPAGRG